MGPDDTIRLQFMQAALLRTETGEMLSLADVIKRLKTPHERLRAARLAAGYRTGAEFARRLNMEVPTYRSHENGNRGYGADEAERYARMLDVLPSWLMFGEGSEPVAQLSKNEDKGGTTAVDAEESTPSDIAQIDAREATHQREVEFGADHNPPDMMDLIPIKSAARGGDDQTMHLGDTMGWAPRPYSLRGVKQAYSVHIVGDSMSPRYRPGVLVSVNPWKKPRREAGVVVFKRDDSVLLKAFVRQTPTELVLEQYNPPMEIRIPLADVRECHVVVHVDENPAS